MVSNTSRRDVLRGAVALGTLGYGDSSDTISAGIARL